MGFDLHSPPGGKSGWVRTSRSRPCPVCQKPDWCSISEDGAVAVCMRVSDGAVKATKNGGWLHRLSDSPRPVTRVVWGSKPTPDFFDRARAHREEADRAEMLTHVADAIGVSPATLRAFGVGWCAGLNAAAIPMVEPATMRVCGIRYRWSDGAKRSATGSRSGLFLHVGGPAWEEPMVICEGATDAFAAYQVGFRNVVGRASCRGGHDDVLRLVRDRKPGRVVLVADNDPPGVAGALELAVVLALYVGDVRAVTPPREGDDLRAWVRAGASREDVAAVYNAAEPVAVVIGVNGGAR